MWSITTRRSAKRLVALDQMRNEKASSDMKPNQVNATSTIGTDRRRSGLMYENVGSESVLNIFVPCTQAGVCSLLAPATK
jgi:hypothetical protein